MFEPSLSRHIVLLPRIWTEKKCDQGGVFHSCRETERWQETFHLASD